jgi:hypothetical protein
MKYKAKIERGHGFVEMEQFLKISMRNEVSFVYLHGLWGVDKECKFLLFPS